MQTTKNETTAAQFTNLVVREWNPRYVAFAKTQGHTPAEQLEIDRAKLGRMVDFMLWIQAQASAWKKANGGRALVGDEAQASFDRFLGIAS